MDLSRKHHYQSLLNQEVDYIKEFVKNKRAFNAQCKKQVWDHGTIYNSQISIINCPTKTKIVFLKDNVAEWMIFGIMSSEYNIQSFEHFDQELEHNFEQVHQACIDFYYSQVATRKFRESLQATYIHDVSFNLVDAEPQPVDPFGADVPSAAPSDFR